MIVLRKLYATVACLALFFGCIASHCAYADAENPSIKEIGYISDIIDFGGMLSPDGLTETGFRMFFPDRSVGGLASWKELSPMARLTFLKDKGARFPRGLWEGRRNEKFKEDMRRSFAPAIAEEKIAEGLNTFGDEAVRRCLNEGQVPEDVCLLFFGRIADPAEVFWAKGRMTRYFLRLFEVVEGVMTCPWAVPVRQ